MQKKYIVFIIIFGFIALKSATSQTIKANFSSATFCNKDGSTYIETYLKIKSTTLKYVESEEFFSQAKAEVTMIFKNIDEVKEFRRYKLVKSLTSSNDKLEDLTDMQRIFISQGVYNFTLVIRDLNAPDSIPDFLYQDIITIDFPKNTIALSDIQLLEKYAPSKASSLYVKDGYLFTPYFSRNYENKNNNLRFYLELYNAAKELQALESFWFEAHIQAFNTGKPIKKYLHKTSQKALNFNKYLQEINISDLPSGNYYLLVNVRDKQQNLLVSKQKFFTRVNAYTPQIIKTINYKKTNIKGTFVEQLPPDSLLLFIEALHPICDSSESTFIEQNLNKSDTEEVKKFFYKFWQQRNSKKPHKAWENYKKQIENVEKNFSDEKNPPLQSDRAKILLKYGSPSTVSQPISNDTTIHYTLWYYYKIADLTNRKFLFRKDMLQGKYRLIKTNMPSEKQNCFENEKNNP